MSCGADATANVERACKLVRDAAARGANIILLQELFETPYFCQVRADLEGKVAGPIDGCVRAHVCQSVHGPLACTSVHATFVGAGPTGPTGDAVQLGQAL